MAFTRGVGRENRYVVRALVVNVRPGSGVMRTIVQVPVRRKVVVGDEGLEPPTSLWLYWHDFIEFFSASLVLDCKSFIEANKSFIKGIILLHLPYVNYY